MNSQSKKSPKVSTNNLIAKSKFICICNQVPQDKIEAAMARGCLTVSKISMATTAGVGQCGGSCKPVIEEMLSYYQENKTFLKEPKLKNRDKRRQ